jgi:hypothetical protein
MKVLLSYYRTSDGRPIGCVAAVDKDKIGWSLCSEKDTFNKELARKIAIGRALKPEKAAYTLASMYKCPSGFMKMYADMYDRALKYYKG